MDLVCIVCPFSCKMKVKKVGNQIIVAGNKCPRGKQYAIDELTHPVRTVTTLVKTGKGVVSVKTDKPVQKDKINEVLKAVENIYVKKAEFGEILAHNVAGTDANIVVTGW